MPGALTPTEVITAWKAGADMVKIFPASAVGGPKYLKALKGPLPDVKMLPTGGVNAHDRGRVHRRGRLPRWASAPSWSTSPRSPAATTP